MELAEITLNIFLILGGMAFVLFIVLLICLWRYATIHFEDRSDVEDSIIADVKNNPQI